MAGDHFFGLVRALGEIDLATVRELDSRSRTCGHGENGVFVVLQDTLTHGERTLSNAGEGNVRKRACGEVGG